MKNVNTFERETRHQREKMDEGNSKWYDGVQKYAKETQDCVEGEIKIKKGDPMQLAWINTGESLNIFLFIENRCHCIEIPFAFENN